MKEKIKKVIIVFTCSVMVFVSILAIHRYSFVLNYYSTVNLKDSKDNLAELAGYQKEVDKLKDSACKTEINKIIDAYKATSLNGTYTIKQMNEVLDKVGVSFIIPTMKNCNLTKEQKKNAIYYMRDIMFFYDDSARVYYTKYTISITDYTSEYRLASPLTSGKYSKQRESYLKLIDHLIQVEKTRGDANEK